MRIAIDARAYSWAGIGRYTRNLLSWLVRLPSAHQFVVLVGRRDVAARNAVQRLISTVPSGKLSIALVESSYYSWREQTLLLRDLYRIRADLFHFTHFNVPLLFQRPFVVTVHDITRFIFPGQTTQRLWRQVAHEYVFAQAVRRASHVICVSDFTRRELGGLPLRFSSATTIYQGVDDVFFAPVSSQDRQRVRMLLGIHEPYLLFVGVWMHHKNLPRLLEACRAACERLPALKLVITGRPRPGYINTARLAVRLGIDDRVVFPEFVPHQLLPALYVEATGLVLPSLYEGLGLPPLEAAACGTPSIVSNVSSFPEIMQSAAYYVNPEYSPGITDVIAHLVGDERHRGQIASRARERVTDFRWDESARQHLAVYERAR